MELDDYKTVWQEYDRKLEKNLRLNEALLRQMNLNQTRNEMKTPLITEYILIIICALFTLWLLGVTFRFYRETTILVTGLICIAITILAFYNSFVKIKMLYQIDYYNSSIFDIQKAILEFQKVTIKKEKIELMLLPIGIPCLLIFVNRVAQGTNLLERLPYFFSLIIGSFAIGLPLVYLIYTQCYKKKTDKACEFLNKIKEFETE